MGNLRLIHIDCSNISSTEEFWQRNVDVVEPRDSADFGRNLDAFGMRSKVGIRLPGRSRACRHELRSPVKLTA